MQIYIKREENEGKNLPPISYTYALLIPLLCIFSLALHYWPILLMNFIIVNFLKKILIFTINYYFLFNTKIN